MATKTRAELINQVLDNLGILVPSQSPTDENVDRIDKLLDAVLASLANREIVYIADAGSPSPPTGGEFDETIFLAVADMVALRVAGAFNLAGDANLQRLADQSEEELRVIGRPPPTRKTLTTDPMLRVGHRRYGSFDYTSGQ